MAFALDFSALPWLSALSIFWPEPPSRARLTPEGDQHYIDVLNGLPVSANIEGESGEEHRRYRDFV